MRFERRQFMKVSCGLLAVSTAGTVLAACGSDEPEPTEPSNEEWEQRAAELESSQESVYTASSPGPWAGKEASHVPALEIGAEVRVETAHGQTVDQPDAEDHFITTLYVRDQNGTVIHLVELDGSEEAPVTSFTPPEGTTEMTAYSYCNLHGLWQSASLAV